MKRRCLLKAVTTPLENKKIQRSKVLAPGLRKTNLITTRGASEPPFKVTLQQNVYPRGSDIRISKLHEDTPRRNAFGIQMLPEGLRSQLFKHPPSVSSQDILLERSRELKRFGLNQKPSAPSPTYNITLPECFNDLEEFFENAADEQLQPYLKFIEHLAAPSATLPPLPETWSREPGWTEYTISGARPVNTPSCSELVFDVEVCIKDGNNLPSLAVAASPHAIYSWVSPGLDEPWLFSRSPSTELLVPLGRGEKVIVGHHVMYDRARVKEEYAEVRSGLRFLDTQSLHVCVSGLVDSQKGKWYSAHTAGDLDKPWMKVGSPNSLAATHKLYCGSDLDKSARDIFVTGSHTDVQEDFQNLMTYCGGDVLATHRVIQKVWPLYKSRFPSKVSLSGMFEMASCYVPLNTSSWHRFIDQSDDMFYNKQGEIKQVLKNLAEDTLLRYNLNRDSTLQDTWKKQLKWDFKQAIGIKNKKLSKKAQEEQKVRTKIERTKVWTLNDAIKTVCHDPPDKPKHLTTAPEWYRDHCPKAASYSDISWRKGPYEISLSNQISPLLLELSCYGNPVYHTHHYGWGYLTLKTKEQVLSDLHILRKHFPDVDILDLPEYSGNLTHDLPTEERLEHLRDQITFFSKRDEKQCTYVQQDFHKISISSTHTGNVGNPLGKLFTGAIEDGLISSEGSSQHVLTTGTGLTFWRNTRDRIKSQFTVQLNPEDFQDPSRSLDDVSVILPQAIPAGTLTRRSTEPLWLTASNVRKDRVGSEFKGIVQPFPGHCFVGADVDSQELWIASLIGDSIYGEHGATPLGWMALQGQKSEGTDMHSKTAEQLSRGRPGLVSRDVAKAFNYARIYGAGKGLACGMLRDNSEGLSHDEITEIIDGMFRSTKGEVRYPLNKMGKTQATLHQLTDDGQTITEENLKVLSSITGYTPYKLAYRKRPVYAGGSESAMFNQLESIARSAAPETPCLKARITRTLEPDIIKDDQLRSRINWVVQSSAVDFLHLLLVAMKWFMKEYAIPGRFTISIHDEVRFHVPVEYRYETALALQLSNLLTRSLFASKLHIYDLPNSVAFFSGVDIDRSLRKSVGDDCISPSNPLGLSISYGIEKGEELGMEKLLQNIDTLRHKSSLSQRE